jgi:hypothetical protein
MRPLLAIISLGDDNIWRAGTIMSEARAGGTSRNIFRLFHVAFLELLYREVIAKTLDKVRIAM